ncbi:MAG: hypothetical protein AB4352_17045 [Hormoscilla sp.]
MTTKTANFQQVATAASTLTPEEQAILLDIIKENISDYLAQRRHAQAWELARIAAKLLREKFGVTRVVVFGALFERIRCGHSADIELAAWGIPPRQYLSAADTVATINPEFEVDLIDLEICSDWDTEAI